MCEMETVAIELDLFKLKLRCKCQIAALCSIYLSRQVIK